jgi:predicted cupin superfamily sugar epimerase
MNTKEDYIQCLNLVPHPEGGWYRQVYHSDDTFFAPESNGDRYRYTSILFLLTSQSPSHFHRLNHDELWYFHIGSPVTIHLISPFGVYSTVQLGNHLLNGEQLQFRVPKNTIFASEITDKDAFAIVSCMVAPGFDYHDFELLSKKQLLRNYPNNAEVIERLASDAKQ